MTLLPPSCLGSSDSSGQKPSILVNPDLGGTKTPISVNSGTPSSVPSLRAVSFVSLLLCVGVASKRQHRFSVLEEVEWHPHGQVDCLVFVIRSSDGLASVAFGKSALVEK